MEANDYNIITEVFRFVNEPIYGLSVCAPVIKQKSADVSGEFKAATCVDVRATGAINDYFFIDSKLKDLNFFLIFNKDMDLEKKTGFYGMGSKIDMMGSDFRKVIDNYHSYSVWKEKHKDPTSTA